MEEQGHPGAPEGNLRDGAGLGGPQHQSSPGVCFPREICPQKPDVGSSALPSLEASSQRYWWSSAAPQHQPLGNLAIA